MQVMHAALLVIANLVRAPQAAHQPTASDHAAEVTSLIQHCRALTLGNSRAKVGCIGGHQIQPMGCSYSIKPKASVTVILQNDMHRLLTLKASTTLPAPKQAIHREPEAVSKATAAWHVMCLLSDRRFELRTDG